MKFRKLKFISLFTGAGGLDIGLENAGFSNSLCVEHDARCRETLKINKPSWKIANPGDIHHLTSNSILDQAGINTNEVDLIAGGPPCQPFSKAAYWHQGQTKRLLDSRADTLNKFMELAAGLLPKVILLENVTAIGFKNKSEGLDKIKESLLEINHTKGTCYKPAILGLNAVDYGVPQSRERLFVIAERNGKLFQSPEATHGQDCGLAPYLRAWDALGDLDTNEHQPHLEVSGKWAALLPTIPEGQNYLWHTDKGKGEPLFGWRTRYWTFLLKLSKKKPSWTIPASISPSNGPFHWRNRRLSVRELARLQSFPDYWEFCGSYREVHSQIGNAVPPLLAEVIGKEILKQYFDQEVSTESDLLLIRENSVPRAYKTTKVPDCFSQLCGKHHPHPGKGKGPGASKRVVS